MGISKFDKFLEEAELNLQELGKLKNGEPRGNVLVKKLKGHEKLTTNNNQEVEISKMKSGDDWSDVEQGVSNITDDSGQYDIDKAANYLRKSGRYQQVFKSTDNKELRLNQLKKTTDFGSSGAGRQIREFETVQCLFLAIKQFSSSLLSTSNLLTAFENYLKIPESERNQILYTPTNITINEDLITRFLDDENWVSTFLRIPNKIWSSRIAYINQSLVYKIFHVAYSGSNSPYTAIDKKYKEFSKSGNYSDINISKYCPADVYLSDMDSNDDIIKDILNTTNINELTAVIDKYFDEKKLLPLSLKKISSDRRISFDIIVNKEEGKDLPDFFIKNFSVGGEMKGIGSKINTFSIWKHRNNKDVKIKNRNIAIDSSDTSKKQNVDAEVEGSSSRHGKISFPAIKRIINSGELKFELNDHYELRKLTKDELKKEIIKYTELMKGFNQLKKELVWVLPLNRARDISESENRLISRLQSLQIVFALCSIYTKNVDLANKLITKITRYALSIETDKFSTPRYLRVI